MSVDTDQTERNRQVRDERDRFLRGCPPGPGRPKGSLDIMTVCRQRAESDGVELEGLVWDIVKSLIDKAATGDTAAAKVILDRPAVVENRFLRLLDNVEPWDFYVPRPLE